MDTLGPFGFLGGWNTKAGTWTLPKHSLSDAQNVHCIYGKLQKVNGSSAINSSALNSSATVIGLFDWQTAAQSRYLVAVAGSKIFQSINLGSSFTDITGSATITAGNNNQHTFASLNNILAICGGSTPDTPLQWTGSGNVSSLAGSPPVGNLVTVANNFMFISGNTTNPSRVWWSNVADPGTWGASNFVDFRVSDGDIVTNIFPLNYNLIIFKRRSTGILFTQQNSTSGSVTLAPLTQINVGIGAAGTQSVAVLPDGRLVVWGIDAHLRLFDGSSYEDISDPPPPYSNIQPTLDGINFSRIQYACVGVYPTLKQIWLSVSTGSNTTNDTIYIYDYELHAWQSKMPDRAANVLATSIDNRSTPHHPIIILSGNYGGNIYEHDTGSVNPENSDSHIDGFGTASIPLGVESTDFIPRSIQVSREAQTSGQLQIGWSTNGLTDISTTATVSESQMGFLLDTTFVMDTSTLAGPATITSGVPIYFNGKAFSIQIQFRNQYASQPFTVHPFSLSTEVIT